MTTSIAICTYNGEKFLREQLESIFAQTFAVDEIVICDDGSKDDTNFLPVFIIDMSTTMCFLP